jgi:hypothetical protein
VLEWRKDVGDERYLEGLAGLLAPRRAGAREAGESSGEAALLPNAG